MLIYRKRDIKDGKYISLWIGRKNLYKSDTTCLSFVRNLLEKFWAVFILKEFQIYLKSYFAYLKIQNEQA